MACVCPSKRITEINFNNNWGMEGRLMLLNRFVQKQTKIVYQPKSKVSMWAIQFPRIDSTKHYLTTISSIQYHMR